MTSLISNIGHVTGAQKTAAARWILLKVVSSDRFTSVINLETVKAPRQEITSYEEGQYISALYGKKL